MKYRMVYFSKLEKKVRKMAEYIGDNVKVVKPGESVGITLPKPIATVKFDAYSIGRYILDVMEDGSWTVKKNDS